jgi:transposase
MEYGAIDLHTKESEIRIVEADGAVVFERRIATTRERLTAVFAGRAPMRILVESSGGSEWVAQHLEGLGHEVVVADPNYTLMYGARRGRVKTDRRDVAALAEANRHGLYRRAHRVSGAQRDVRRRLRVREQLVHVRRQTINLLRAHLRSEGVRVPTGAAETFGARFTQSAVSAALREAMAPLLELLTAMAPLIGQADQWTRRTARRDAVARRLMTAPGVGPVVALSYQATVDDAGRFAGPGAVAAYLGLVPRETSSGERQRKGAITKAGPSRMRVLLVQSAWSIWRSPRGSGALHAWARRVGDRRGRRIAIVAVARRLARILWALWRDARDFHPAQGKRGAERVAAA